MQLVDPATMRDLIRSKQMHQQLTNQPTILALLEIEKTMLNVNQKGTTYPPSRNTLPTASC